MATSFGSQSQEKLPDLEDLKFNSSYYIGANTDRKLKAYDFMGYAKRKDIFDNHTKMPLAPAPLDARFELPSDICPLISTKHKRTPGVSLGTYSPRKFFTDQIKDYPFSSFRPKADKPLVKDRSPREGKMPCDIENAPQIAKLFA